MQPLFLKSWFNSPLVQGEIKTCYNSEQYEFKVTVINMLETAKAVNKDFVDFIDKNVKANPRKSSIKFNINEPALGMKIGLYTLEKGFTLNDEMVTFLEENKDLEVAVVTILFYTSFRNGLLTPFRGWGLKWWVGGRRIWMWRFRL